MPSLDIDYKRQLSNTVAPYSDHLLIHTGSYIASQWPSRIEDDPQLPLVNVLKQVLKKRVLAGVASGDKAGNVLVSAVSFPSSQAGRSQEKGKVDVSLMKAGLHIAIDSEDINTNAGLVDALLPSDGSSMDSREAVLKQFSSAQSINDITILICGHDKRDSRCGIMGPLLQNEFEDKLARAGAPVASSTNTDGAQIGLVSHVGGHVFAGNVILYVPSGGKYAGHPLVGKAVWYGRVRPEHIEGVVQRTIKDGVIIEDLLRGVV